MASTSAPTAHDTPSQPSASSLDQVRAAIRSHLHQPSYDDGSCGPVLVRLAWHSAGTYDHASNSGGSNGAGMRWENEGGDPANAGLQHARAFLEPVKREFSWLTYADLWTLAAVVAIQEMDGPSIPWRGGRTDFANESDKRIPPRGRLPDGAKGADHIRHIFYRMGFNDQEIVALSGAHNLGRCHADRSGFEGKWVNNPTRFSNTYFKLLLTHPWIRTRLASGIEQYVYVDPDEAEYAKEQGEQPETLMMLPSDIALIEDPKFRVWVERYAKDKDLFFHDFASVFAKLLELGIERDTRGNVVNRDNVVGGYKAAPKKSDTPTAPEQSKDHGKIDEASPLKGQNEKFHDRQQRLRGKRVNGAKL